MKEMDKEKIGQLPSTEFVGLIKVYNSENLVNIIPNLPGKQSSLRVFYGLQRNNELNRNAISEALDIFGDVLIAESKLNPGKHPNIDLLLNMKEGNNLRLDILETKHKNLFQKLNDKTATPEEKIEGMELLENGKIRTAEKINGIWQAQLYGIDAMNSVFSISDNFHMGNGFYDKVPLLTSNWNEERFKEAGVRFIPGSFARRGAYIGKGTVLMPGGIVNTGAHIAGDGVMIDGGARVATGAQVGKAVKIGAGTGLEGMLEPKGVLPTILEDNVRIGANCEIKGIIEKGSVVGSGVIMASGTKIYDERKKDYLEPLYIQVGEKILPMLHIPEDRIAVTGVYVKNGSSIGGTCVRLLEKPASETEFAQTEKNVTLYTTFK